MLALGEPACSRSMPSWGRRRCILTEWGQAWQDLSFWGAFACEDISAHPVGSREFLWDNPQTPPTQGCQCWQGTGVSLNAPQLALSSCQMPLARASPLPGGIGIPAANPRWGVPRGGPLIQGDAHPWGPRESPSVGLLSPTSPHYLVAFQSSSRDPTASRSSHMVVSVSFPATSTKHCPAKAVVTSGGSAW